MTTLPKLWGKVEGNGRDAFEDVEEGLMKGGDEGRVGVLCWCVLSK
jgi:hypothetical protein